VATGYKIDGKMTEDFPMTLEEVVRAEPIYEIMAGWDEDIREVRRMEDLPDNARRYVARIEALVDVPAAFVSVGPGRDEIIKVSDPFTS
jgi:adenylosuccinate synthase